MSTTTTIDAPVAGAAVPGARAAGRRPAAVAAAVRDIVPIAASVAPFGLLVGVAQGEAGLDALPALVTTVLVYAGSAHLATLGVLASGGGLVGAVLTGVLVNARLLLYSADVSRHVADQPRWFRVVGSMTIIDQTHALLPRALAHGRRGARRYWLTVGAILTSAWLVATSLGTELGNVLPTGVPAFVAAPAVFAALLVPRLADPRLVRAAIAAASVAVLARGLPAGLGMVLALVAAMVVTPPAVTEENPS